MLVVDFPSPAGVGVIAVTNTNLPSGLSSKRRIASKEILLYNDHIVPISSGVNPHLSAMT